MPIGPTYGGARVNAPLLPPVRNPNPSPATPATGTATGLRTALGGSGNTVNPNPFGSLGPATGGITNQGFIRHANATGLPAQLLNAAERPGSLLTSEDRIRNANAALLGSAAQGEYLNAETATQNLYDYIARLNDETGVDQLNQNSDFGQRVLDQLYGNINTLGTDTNARRDATIEGQSGVTDLYNARTGDVLQSNTLSGNTLQSVLANLGSSGGAVRGRVASDNADRTADYGAIDTGYRQRTGGVENTAARANSALFNRQTANDTGNARLQGLQSTNQGNRLGEQAGLDSGYLNRISDIMSLLDLRGREASSDIERAAQRQKSQSTSDLVSRGLYNTTVTDSARRGIEEDRSREQRGLDEQLRGQEFSLLQQLTGDALQNQRQTSAVRNELSNERVRLAGEALDRNNQVRADTIQGLRDSSDMRSRAEGESLNNLFATAGARSNLTNNLSGIDIGNLVREASAGGEVARNQADRGTIQAGLTGDAAESAAQGVEYGSRYDQPLMAQVATLLGQGTTTGAAQNATDTALRNTVNRNNVGFLQNRLADRPGPTFLELQNIWTQLLSESPVPTTSQRFTGTYQS